MNDSNARSIRKLLKGARDESIPCFSCLSTIIAPALTARGLKFAEIHHDAGQMVAAASAAHELYGWQSATLPTDLILEAEALGATIDFRGDMPEPMWPLAPEPRFAAPQDVTIPRGDFTLRGRIPLVLSALQELKARVGQACVVGAWIPGPFTLALQVTDYNALLPAVKHSPAAVARALDQLTEALAAVGNAYHDAGAEFVTIHEMGGSPGVLGPTAFGDLILPRLQRLVAALPAPTILSVCGNTNSAMPLLAEAGATALHLDQTNDLARSRQTLGHDALLFGNLDPVKVIAHGTAETIRQAVNHAAKAGADAIMPGCDLYLATPAENLVALQQAARALVRPR